jgi:DNA-binding CsgD family transcriptional regulator
MVLIRSSRVADAATALDEADRMGGWVAILQPQEYMAHILVRAYQGDLDEARRLTGEALAEEGIQGLAYWRGGFLAQLGFIETSAREWQAALPALRELAGLFAKTGMVDLEQLLWPVDYADAALQVGALDEVAAAIDLLRRQGAVGRPEATVAADRCQALLTAARGDTDTALHELVRITDLEDAECPFEAARSKLALGQVYRRAGYKGMSNQTLVAAAEAFDVIGTPRWAERARHEAARTGLHPSTGLTETERRVAQLVATGRSNQETADELFISAKTVEANLTRIYRKLAVRSRTELAARLSSNPTDLP